MTNKLVHVQTDETGLPCRIFRDKSWRLLPDSETTTMTKQEAVGCIRQRVYDRCMVPPNDDQSWHECERCGRTIDWDTMEMHETIPKGSGGEVSLENCEALCRACHQTGLDAAHKDRKWQTSKLSPEGQNGH